LNLPVRGLALGKLAQEKVHAVSGEAAGCNLNGVMLMNFKCDKEQRKSNEMNSSLESYRLRHKLVDGLNEVWSVI
jgi:hypothetical protein